MIQEYKSKLKYLPYVTTQIFEEQNCFLLQNDFIRDNYSQFNYILYQYLDQKPSNSSFFRIFRIKKKVSLVYYWKSEKREPRSNRKGIYLIVGVLCDYSTFCKAPLCLYMACICLLDMIMKKYHSNNCTKIISKIWREQAQKQSSKNEPPENELFSSNSFSLVPMQGCQNTEDIFEEIGLFFQSAYRQYMREEVLPQYVKKIRFGICRLHLCVPSSSAEDIPLFFVSEAANWICHWRGKMDIASIEGYGEWFIDVRLNNQGVPPKMKQVKLSKRFGKTYLEIRTC